MDTITGARRLAACDRGIAPSTARDETGLAGTSRTILGA